VDPVQQMIDLTEELVWVSLLANAAGVVACFWIAKARKSKRVAFWTTMGLVFGPFAIPFAWWRTGREQRLNAPSAQ
jgi:hypothetical protein